MPGLLIDTSALIVLADRSDDRHSEALHIRRTVARGRLYVTDYVLDETVTLLIRRGGSRTAHLLMDEVRARRAFELIFVGPELFWKSEARMRKLADQAPSFTDCTSFSVMDHLRLDAAFAFDDDFIRAGYRVVPFD